MLRELTLAHDVLLIFDEIATGFGRTGSCSRPTTRRSSPDVMCVGKALTGGYLSMGATLCTRAGRGRDLPRRGAGAGARADVHGQPAVVRGGVGVDRPAAVAGLARRGEADRGVAVEGLAPARDLPGVVDVRVLGAIGVVQLDHEVDLAAATEAAVAAGAWLRPFRDLIYTMPPFVATVADLETITGGVLAGVRAA